MNVCMNFLEVFSLMHLRAAHHLTRQEYFGKHNRPTWQGWRDRHLDSVFTFGKVIELQFCPGGSQTLHTASYPDLHLGDQNYCILVLAASNSLTETKQTD